MNLTKATDLTNVVTRSLWLLVVSTVIVLLSAAFLQPETTHSSSGHSESMADAYMPHEEIISEADFIAGMVPHHQEAVASAQQFLVITERQEMRELAQAVIEVQTEEITTLESWLASWYPNAAPDLHYQPMMRDLEGLSPNEADRVFLEDMLMHHGMAIDMAEAYLAGDFEKRAEVVAMAEEIVTVQDEENVQMRTLLEAWYGPDAGHQSH